MRTPQKNDGDGYERKKVLGKLSSDQAGRRGGLCSSLSWDPYPAPGACGNQAAAPGIMGGACPFFRGGTHDCAPGSSLHNTLKRFCGDRRGTIPRDGLCGGGGGPPPLPSRGVCPPPSRPSPTL